MIRRETTLRPRTFGEILDLALESLRGDLGVIAAASLVVNAPLAAVLLVLIYGVTVLGAETVPFIVPLSAIAAGLLLARALAQGAIARLLAARIEEGSEPRLGRAYLGVLKRALPVVFAGAAFWAVALAAGLLYVLPGVVMGGWLALAVPTAALEDRTPFQVLGRSTRLLKGHSVRSMGLLGFVLALYPVVSANVFAAVYGGLVLSRTLFGLRTGYYETILSPRNGFYVTAILLAVHLVIEPWKACAFYHLHLDARVRYEALDLRRKVESLARSEALASARRPPEVPAA